jgi:hypothetical protein
MEMLRNMPNSETLKELLEFSMMFAQMCRESGERRGAPHSPRAYYLKIF